jgi:hypothetical protein
MGQQEVQSLHNFMLQMTHSHNKVKYVHITQIKYSSYIHPYSTKTCYFLSLHIFIELGDVKRFDVVTVSTCYC